MERLRYKKVDKAIFQEKLSNGINALVCPIPNSKEVKIGLVLSIGGYQNEIFIDKQRILPGSFTLLVEALKKKHSELADPLFDGICSFNTVIYESYISFEVSCKIEDSGKYLKALLHYFDEFNISNDELEGLKPDVYKLLESTYESNDNILRNNLYFSSPMKYSPLGSADNIKSCHLPSLRKIFNKYFNGQYLSLFAMGNLNPNDVASIATNNFKKRESIGEVNIKPIKENYNKVYQTLGYLNKSNTLVLGVKFPKREELFNRFKGNNFLYTFIVQNMIFSKMNPRFVSKIVTYSNIKNVSLHEGGEDIYLSVEFETENPNRLHDELELMLSSKEFITFWEFRKSKKEMLNKMVDIYKNDINLYYERLLASYANDYADTALAEMAYKCKYNKFVTFYKYFITFPRSYLISK